MKGIIRCRSKHVSRQSKSWGQGLLGIKSYKIDREYIFGHKSGEIKGFFFLFSTAVNLAHAENQINEQNKKYKNGESGFFEKLNAFSDLSKAQFENEKEGAVIPKTSQGRGLGAILPPESEWYTSPELEELYASRQNPPKSYDATALSK